VDDGAAWEIGYFYRQKITQTENYRYQNWFLPIQIVNTGIFWIYLPVIVSKLSKEGWEASYGDHLCHNQHRKVSN
jgi:hypothetical protein